jgi:hypothetical protein
MNSLGPRQPAEACTYPSLRSSNHDQFFSAMSGVEIAGLALAVLPILIAAAEYAKSRGSDPRRAEFMENLAFEVTLLHMSLTRLAKGLSELPNELREKLSSPQAAQDLEANWKSIEVVYALKKRLGPGYETFVVTLRAILDCLERLLDKKSLGLSTDEAVRVLASRLLPGADDVTDSLPTHLREIARDSRQNYLNTHQHLEPPGAIRPPRNEKVRPNPHQDQGEK